MIVVAIVVVIIALAVIALLMGVVKSFGQSAARQVAEAPPISQRPAPTVTDFHVQGDTAKALFSVPLGDAIIGDHLKSLLSANAVEYVRTRKAAGLPLEDVRRIEVSAMRGSDPEVVCFVDLPEPGVLPDTEIVPLIEPEHDPIAAVAAVVADSSVSAPSGDSRSLEKVSSFIELSAPIEAHIRSIGVDPADISLDALAVALFQVSGYEVSPGGTGFKLASAGNASLYTLVRGGQKTVLAVVEHVEGTHPELDEKVLSEFAVGVAQTNPDVAILVTDEYSPYSMYEREKRDKRMVFITRERLQSFVDSFGVS